MALRSGIPVIPIGIRGSNQAYPFVLRSRNPFKVRTKYPIQINIGTPICLKQHRSLDMIRYSDETRLTLRRLTENLMDRLAELSGLPNLFPANPLE